MKTLLIGTEPSLVFETWGEKIRLNPKQYEILMLYIEDTPIPEYPDLCIEAIIAQKRHNLFRLGKKAGITKITNLNIDTFYLDVEKLAIQLRLYVMLGGITNILYQENIKGGLRILLDKTKETLRGDVNHAISTTDRSRT